MLTSDISKLVNLTSLFFADWVEDDIPNSISCLQKLKTMYVSVQGILGLGEGLATLENLGSLTILSEDVWFPKDMKVPEY